MKNEKSWNSTETEDSSESYTASDNETLAAVPAKFFKALATKLPSTEFSETEWWYLSN